MGLPITLAGSPATGTVAVSNPYGYGGSWVQGQMTRNYLGSALTKLIGSVANTPAIPGDLTLPALNLALGPNAIPDLSSIAYSGGVLSIGAVAGTDVYAFILNDTTTRNGAAIVLSTSPSLTLPAWLQSEFATHSISVEITPIGANLNLGPSSLGAFMDLVSCKRLDT